jgi:pSer/pThr/pTyr-binding forkhead associated (FHA) protein
VPAALIVSPGSADRREVPLDRDTLVIGRDADCDVVVDHPLASRRHARVSRDDRRFRLEDLDSRNGTFLNGERLPPSREKDPPAGRLLAHGDTVDVAGVFAMQFHDPEATRAGRERETTAAPAGAVRMDDERREVSIDGRRLDPPLTPQQYRLLGLLVERAGKICTRDQIVTVVWPGSGGGVSDEAVDALVKRLRGRLKEAAPARTLIEFVRGHGVRLVLSG